MSKIRTPAMERYDRRHKSAKKTTPGAEAWRRFTRNRTACVSLLILLVMMVFVIGANWIAPYEYQEMGSMPFQLSSAEHLFGTDNYGRDLFSRCVYGARYTLFISVLCVVAACFSGGLLGILAGYFGGKTDEIIMRIMDILQAIPAVLLAICISSALGNGIPQLVIAIMIASMPVLSHNFRAAILNVKNAEYVESSRSIGVSEGRMIVKHMLAQRLRNSYPHELDGGRRQRIGVARALALNPEFIVCDEPVSALDVSIQAQILNLLQDLQKDMNLTYMFITHDMSVVKHISNDIAVMYLGQLIEKCDAKELFRKNYHPYTKALLSAIPVPNIHVKREKILLKGELSSPINPKPCCRFAVRCPYATEACFHQEPQLREIEPNHFVACHRAGEV